MRQADYAGRFVGGGGKVVLLHSLHERMVHPQACRIVEGTAMTTCAQCGGEQHYSVFFHDEQDRFVYWFCSVGCKKRWLRFKKKNTNGKIVRLAGATLLALIIFVGSAQGAPDPDSPLPYKDWFESVHNREGAWCCTVADGHMTDYSYDGQNYKVKIEGQFYLIPWNSPIISVRHDKPFIGGVIWYYHNSDGSIAIRCFVADDAT